MQTWWAEETSLKTLKILSCSLISVCVSVFVLARTFLFSASPVSRGDDSDGNLSLASSFIPSWARILLHKHEREFSSDPQSKQKKLSQILLGFLHAVVQRIRLRVRFCQAIGWAGGGGAWRGNKLLPFFQCLCELLLCNHWQN